MEEEKNDSNCIGSQPKSEDVPKEAEPKEQLNKASEGNSLSSHGIEIETIASRQEDDSSVVPSKPEEKKEEKVPLKLIEKEILKPIEEVKLIPEPSEAIRKESAIEDYSIDEEEQYLKVEALAKDYDKMINEKIRSTAENFKTFIKNLSKSFASEKEEDKQNRKKRNQKMKKIDQVLSLASVLLRSIETNFELLNLMLQYSGTDILNIKQFVGENIEKILDSWLITHMDSDQLSNLKQNNKTPQNIKNYIFQDLKKALKHLKISGTQEIDMEGIMKINKTNLKKLTVKHVHSSMFEKLFRSGESSEVFSLVSKVDIKQCNLEKVDISHYFPEIDTLSIQFSKISFGNFDKLKLQRLTELSLSKINMTNNCWNMFKKGLLANRHLINNLEFISLANNKLSTFSLYDNAVKTFVDRESLPAAIDPPRVLDCQIDPKQTLKSNQSGEELQQSQEKEPIKPLQSPPPVKKRKFAFPNLKTIDLENNKLSKFLIENYNMVESLQVLNLVSNNVSFVENLVSLQRQIKENGVKRAQTLVLLQKNNYLFKPEKRQEYLDYLLQLLASFKYTVKSLTFDYLFYLNNKNVLSQLKFSPKIQESLRSLSFSSCSLSNAEVISIIKDNNFERLRKLDISCNFIDDNLFKDSKIKLSNAEAQNQTAPALVKSGHNDAKEKNCVFEKLAKLEELNLSGNKIRGEADSIENIKDFLKSNVNLKKIEFFNTPLEDLLGTLLKEIKKREKKNTPPELQGENKEKSKDQKVEEALFKILKQAVQELEPKDFNNKATYSLLEFILEIDAYNSQLKLYFKNNYSSGTAKRLRSLFKNIRMKKLTDREIINLPQ